MNQILAVLFGAGWKTTLLGAIGAAGIEIAAVFDKQSGIGWHVLAMVILALARLVPDPPKPPAP